jgi:miniconductance mechanosensitive channel
MPNLPDNWLGATLAVAILLLVAWAADRATYRLFLGVVRRMASRTRSTWDDRLIERKVFSRLAHAVPGAIVYYGVGPTLGLGPGELAVAASPIALTAALAQRVALAFIVVTAASAVSAFLDALNDIYTETYEQARSRPIKGYLQVVGLALYIAVGVVVVSILANRSPVVFLSGLGALTAVLLLVFRDTILSFVASLQIASNDMIRIGDWVEMPQANADGDVIDIALHTVKIQNWDKTISTIPTHRFITESFKNWRGMSQAGGRRIKRAVALDMSSIRFLADEEIDRLSRYELLREYMRAKREQLRAFRERKGASTDDVIPEARRLTNVGTYRAYVFAYLKAHPMIHDEMTLLVRQLAPTSQGLPIELYCFSNDTAWANYEALQADIFDHLIAILPEFGLEPFQEPAGSDLGWLAARTASPSEAIAP